MKIYNIQLSLTRKMKQENNLRLLKFPRIPRKTMTKGIKTVNFIKKT